MYDAQRIDVFPRVTVTQQSAADHPTSRNLSASASPPAERQSGPPVGPDLVGRTLSGNLRVVDQLGETPEGTLYRAEYPTGLEVAVLALRGVRDGPNGFDGPAALLRLQQQLRQAIQIKHPNVAAAYEIGETSDPLVYVVLERLAGELLSSILTRQGTVSLHQALDLCLQAAAGLQAAHEVGLVHGNLSPSTILITEADGQSRVKLIRFAPSSSSPVELPKPIYMAPVRPGYASPERLSGHPPDQRSDVFSLGAVLHHLLTGAPPEGARIGPLPEVMRTVLARALAWDPAQRFETIREFASALERAALAASRPKATTNRALIRKAAGAGLVLVTFAVLWMSWSWWRPPGSEAQPMPGTLTRAPPAQSVEARSTPPKTDQGVLVVRDSIRRGISNPPADGRSPPRSSRAQAAIKQGSDSTDRPTKTSARSGSDPPTPKADKSVAASVRRTDSVRQPKYLSPFLRSHPWAAIPGKRFYFRSTCRVVLQSTELLYFKSVDEARASGFVPSPVPGCH
jgi:serine/threonine protein kinase